MEHFSSSPSHLVAEKTRMFADLKAQAEAAVAQYPQYKGLFDDYVLVGITKTIKTKLGVAFQIHDFAIASPTVEIIPSGPTSEVACRSVWSFRNKIGTMVRTQFVVNV